MTHPRELEIDYGLDPVEVIIRISWKQVKEFNRLNSISIDQLQSQLARKEIDCTFQKTSEEEHRVFIPLEQGCLECHVKEHELSGTYETVLKKSVKTAYRENPVLPDSDLLRETCSVRIIDLEEGGRGNRPSAEFEELQDKVSALPIASIINIGNQQEIWFKYIEAQQAILADLEKSYKVKGQPRLQELLTKDRKVSRYSLQFDLAHEFLPEFRQLEKKLKELGIEQRVSDGDSILLTREEIEVLDAVIDREFPEVLERSPYLGAIVKLKPQTIEDKIKGKIPVEVAIEQDPYSRDIIVSANPNAHLAEVMKRFGFELKELEGIFRVSNYGDLQGNEEFNAKRKVTFGSRFVRSNYEFEQLLPYPDGDIFRVRRKDIFGLRMLYLSLSHVYGRENISASVNSVFKPIDQRFNYRSHNSFSVDFWTRVKRKLYLHGLEESVNPSTESLFLEFRDEEELNDQFALIEELDDCEVVYSPLNEGFRFKVKVNLIAKKTEKELFLEKLKRLRGAEFVVEVGEEGKRKPRLQFLGKLNGYESDLQKISLYIPNYFPGDKKKAKEVLKFLDSEAPPEIKFIRANLTGDRTKVGWLQNAVEKISNPTPSPNGSPVNDRIGEFIFDTSKATPVYNEAKLQEGSEHYRDVMKFQLLSLNESQRKAVLAAINCDDLALLQGPPGTGKTTIIAEMIWQMIRKDPKHRILLTSETNLAVDNALDRLLNQKNVNPDLVRNLTLIKPLRFGRMSKMDEEGAKYSAERIHQWVDPEFEHQVDEVTTLDEQGDDMDEDAIEGRPENNAVLDWMKRIASRAKNNDPKYAGALKDWALDLAFPSQEVKELFSEKYFEYANIVGSTCSSAGSPRFMWDFAETILGDDIEQLKKLNYHAQFAPFGRDFDAAMNSIGVSRETKSEFQRLSRIYQGDRKLVYRFYRDEPSDFDLENEERFRLLQTIDGRPPKHGKDTNRLVSFQNLVEFTRRNIAPHFEPRVRFDTVIMDEASKATPPELMLPLCLGKRSVVIGDHRQLPPMLNEKDFREALIDAGASKLAEEIDREFTETSQFERMILNPKVSPTIISRCNIQYRMHPDINSVINQFYLGEGGLEPAQEIIQNANDRNLDNVFSRHHGLYKEGLIDPNIHTIWIDVKSPESKEGTSAMNEGEVKIVRQVIQLLKEAEGFNEFQDHWKFIKDNFKRLQEQQIGVISFYGAQKRLLKRSLAGLGVPLKINTVDRFQGMERNIVIVSTVRSHHRIALGKKTEPNRDSGFAKSPQRLNVALSRARRLLIVVGNRDFFSRVKDSGGRPLYKNAIEEIAAHGRIIDGESLLSQSQ